MTRPATCEWCTWWRARIVGYGKVACVCQCTESVAKYMIETGAAETCGCYEPRKESKGNGGS